MSNVVAFPISRRKRRDAVAAGPFQLLFFTGVRYVRQEEAGAVKRRRAPRAKTARKRRA